MNTTRILTSFGQVDAFVSAPMFYAIYQPHSGLWRNEDGDYGPFKNARRYDEPMKYVKLYRDERWVGPLVEGEEP